MQPKPVTTSRAHEDLPHLIQWIKDQSGDTDSGIARRIGVAPSTVNAWILARRGQGRGPAPKTLRALAAAYANIGLTEERVFAAVGRRKPGPLSEERNKRLLALLDEMTEEQQRMMELQARAVVEDNRSGQA